MGRTRRGRARRAAPARLFEPAELDLRPTGEARFRDMARTPPRSLSEREARAEEDHLTMERLRSWARYLASRFRLRYTAIEAERHGVNEHYGICYEDGVIRIRLRHAVTERLLKESSLVDTLCHELAHLRHFDHSPRFKRLYIRMLEEARRRGYYRPGPDGKTRNAQGRLFDWCGVEAPCGTGEE